MKSADDCINLVIFCSVVKQFVELVVNLTVTTFVSPVMLAIAIVMATISYPIERYFVKSKRRLRKLMGQCKCN